MTGQTLRHKADEADAKRFVGREPERQTVANLFDKATPSRVLYVHGSGGIGKSTLLRFIGREAARHGLDVETIDTRSGSRAVDARLAEVSSQDGRRRCVIIDEADLLGSELVVVRDRLIDTLPDTARIVFGGRRPPDPTWRLDGLDTIVVDLALSPLSDEDATRLLATHGVDPARVNDLLAWAQGSPLALTVAALTPEGPHGASVSQTLEARLTAWISGSPIMEISPEVLEVAALTPVVDARILAAALPARPTRDAMARLTALPVVERLGDRAALHPVLAAAIDARFCHHEPERYRLTRKRIAEHLGARARLGDITALVELSQFIADAELRQAISNHPSPSLFTDVPSPKELESFATMQGFAQEADWLELDAFQSANAPHRLVVRQSDRSIVMAGAFVRADEVNRIGPVTTSLATAVDEYGVDPTRSFVGTVLFADTTEGLRADAARLGSGALMHLHGIADMQAVIIHFPRPDRRPLDALKAMAHPVRVALDRPVSISDYRPDGAVGFVESIVLGELGYPAQRLDLTALLTVDENPDRQARLRARVDEVFGNSAEDQRLRRVIELVHLGPRQHEQEYLEALHVSRRTWFRLLRQARERVLGSGS